MSETLNVHGAWTWANIMHDLHIQGGLSGVIVDPFTVRDHSCGGETEAGTKFHITWIPDVLLLVSMDKDEPALVEAFAKVVGYEPFCRYVEPNSGFTTYEWDKRDPDGRFKELADSSEKKDLERLEASLQDA